MRPTITIHNEVGSTFYHADSLVVSMDEGRHDSFSVYLSNPEGLDASVTGRPCSISWGAGASPNSLVGYIDTVAEMTGDGLPGKTLVCIGASSVMRSGTARTWRRSPPLRIASNIVRPYKLGLLIDKYPHNIDSFMQSSESDWHALINLAAATGTSLVADGTVVKLIDVRKEIGRSTLTRGDNYREPDAFVQLDTNSPAGFDQYEFSGIDRLGSTFKVRGGEGVKRHAQESFSSLDDALNAARRREDRTRLLVRATATYSGPMSVRNGAVINVEGRPWYVANCRHEVSLETYGQTTVLELHRSEKSRPSTASSPTPPVPVVRHGAWVSAQSFEVEL